MKKKICVSLLIILIFLGISNCSLAKKITNTYVLVSEKVVKNNDGKYYTSQKDENGNDIALDEKYVKQKLKDLFGYESERRTNE